MLIYHSFPPDEAVGYISVIPNLSTFFLLEEGACATPVAVCREAAGGTKIHTTSNSKSEEKLTCIIALSPW